MNLLAIMRASAREKKKSVEPGMIAELVDAVNRSKAETPSHSDDIRTERTKGRRRMRESKGGRIEEGLAQTTGVDEKGEGGEWKGVNACGWRWWVEGGAAAESHAAAKGQPGQPSRNFWGGPCVLLILIFGLAQDPLVLLRCHCQSLVWPSSVVSSIGICGSDQIHQIRRMQM